MKSNYYSNLEQGDNKNNLCDNRFSNRSTYESLDNEGKPTQKQGFNFNESSTIEDYEAYILRNFQAKSESPKDNQIEYRFHDNLSSEKSIDEIITSDYSYYGQLEYGMRHGFGICRFSNGNRYTGKWKRDRMHGVGKLETHQGVYQGDFRQNLPNGYMEFVSSEGVTYFGYMNGFVFMENEPLIVKSNTLYLEMIVNESFQSAKVNKRENEFNSNNDFDDSMPASPDYSELNLRMTVDDVVCNDVRGSTRDFTHYEAIETPENFDFPHVLGIGSILYDNGNFYLGSIKDNNQDGLGILKKESMIYQGFKDHDHYNGLCEVLYKDGTKFCGNLVENKRHGFAIFYRDSIINICKFHDGVKDGPSLTYKYDIKGSREDVLLDIFSLGWRTKQISKHENIINYLELYSPQFLPFLNIDCQFLIGVMSNMDFEL